MKKYSNTRATLAIAKASFRSILRSPSAVVFSLAFPLIFILVFANIGGSGVAIDVGVGKGCDTLNPIYKALKEKAKMVNLVTNETPEEMKADLSKGSIDAIMDIRKAGPEGITLYPPLSALPKKQKAPYTVNVQYTKASAKGAIFQSVLADILTKINEKFRKIIQIEEAPVLAEVKETTVTGREYKYIDFILPGQLGFSLLSSGVFGTAFVFLSLRLTLVIKRFFATPVKRYSIVLGEALARLTFSLLGALFILMVGHFAFGFTLVHGGRHGAEYACALRYRAYHIHGLRVHHIGHRQKREYRTAAIQYHYAAAVPAIGHLLFGNGVPKMAAIRE
jgi:ABC-2 type transport system permease protein